MGGMIYSIDFWWSMILQGNHKHKKAIDDLK